MIHLKCALTAGMVLLMAAQIGAQAKRFRLPAVLEEASGLYYAAPDSLWWHNDSGDGPRLLLTDGAGRLQREVLLPVRHVDWEDITHDNQGNIYIGDFGNNANRRKDLCIYIYRPNENVIDSILFDYPDQHAFPPPVAQWNFDMEGFFWHEDSLHLFSKNRLQKGNYYTKHYTLPAQSGTYTAVLRDSVHLKKRVVTAAAISPDGQTVALLAYYFNRRLGFVPITATSIYAFHHFNDNNFTKGKIRKQPVRKFLVPTQYEALDFIDNRRVYVASERTPLFRQRAKRVRLRLPPPVVIKP